MPAWTLKVRRGGATERSRHESLADALAAMERRLDELATGERRRDERFLGREFPAATVVAARAELRGPRGAHGGVDLHADRTTLPWTGRLRRRAVDPAPGETSYEALARVLTW
ncbi:MAG TPA: hypothetical protein VLA98_13625 [Solirubrobacteraceae bacterium]|nr:hypothetical protein [Solirubrobacteraceae bacterium]